MTNKKYNVVGSDITLELDDGLLTTGTIGAIVSFTFNDEWSGLMKTAVFRGGGVTKSVDLPGDSVNIPWEVLLMEGPLQVGVEGRSADGSVVFPTIWNNKCWVHKGASPSGDPSVSPTLPIWFTIQKTIGDINDLKTKNQNNIVEAINELVDGGGHGSTSFIVKVSRSENRLIADHTVSEIIDRIKNAEIPWCYEELSDVSRVFPLVSYNETLVLFGGIQGSRSVLVTISDDRVYISEDTIALSENLSSIGNKVYELGLELNKKVTSPESGEPGHMLVVDDVDESGTPTGWKCVPAAVSSEMHVGDEPPEDANTAVWLDTRGGDSPDYIPSPTAATVGQTMVVKETDGNGKPVAWECVDMAAGSDGGYYTPSLSQTQSDKAIISWSPSNASMPSIASEAIILPQGPAGNSGVYVGTDEPTDPSVQVWVDEDDDADIIDYIPAPATAQVGQTIVVKEVDGDGKPVSWECVDLAGGGEKWKELRSFSIPTDPSADTSGITWITNDNGEVTGFEFDTDKDGNPFECSELSITTQGACTADGTAFFVLDGIRVVGHSTFQDDGSRASWGEINKRNGAWRWIGGYGPTMRYLHDRQSASMTGFVGSPTTDFDTFTKFGIEGSTGFYSGYRFNIWGRCKA